MTTLNEGYTNSNLRLSKAQAFGTRLLLVNGLVLGLIAFGAGALDLLGYFSGTGPIGPFQGQPLVVGLFEAHGLAFMLSTMLVINRKAPTARWNLVAALMHLLFGCSNLVFWQFFVDTSAVPMGTVITLMHFGFFAIEAAAVVMRRGESNA